MSVLTQFATVTAVLIALVMVFSVSLEVVPKLVARWLEPDFHLAVNQSLTETVADAPHCLVAPRLIGQSYVDYVVVDGPEDISLELVLKRAISDKLPSKKLETDLHFGLIALDGSYIWSFGEMKFVELGPAKRGLLSAETLAQRYSILQGLKVDSIFNAEDYLCDIKSQSFQKQPQQANESDSLPVEPSTRHGSKEEQDLNPYKPSLVFMTSMLGDVEAVFRANLDLYLEGDPEAKFWISKVAENCRITGGFETREDYESYRLQHRTFEIYDQVLPPLIPVCVGISEYKPESSRWDEWAYRELQSSAESGYPIAQLEVLTRFTPISAQNYRETAHFLEDLILGGDHLVYYHAALFFTRYRHFRVNDDPNKVDLETWWLIGCESDPLCDRDVKEAQLRQHYLPSFVDEVIARAGILSTAIKEKKSIRFFDQHTQDLIEGSQ